MVTKILMGATTVSIIALGIVFGLLLKANEDKGRLEGEISNVLDINAGQDAVIVAMKVQADNLAKQAIEERKRAAKAVADRDASDKAMKENIKAAEARMSKIMAGLTDDEMVCVGEPVPEQLIDGLRSAAGSDQDDSG